MTNVKALKNLYVALGGSSSTVANMVLSADVIAAIATLMAAKEPELPTVTASDNGKVLKVIDGAWGVGTDAIE